MDWRRLVAAKEFPDRFVSFAFLNGISFCLGSYALLLNSQRYQKLLKYVYLNILVCLVL